MSSDQATSHYLNQWWLDHWRIYVSLGLSELNEDNVSSGQHSTYYIDNIFNTCFHHMQSFSWFHNFPDWAIFTKIDMKFEWHTISNDIIKLHYPEASLVNWGFEYPIKVGILSIIPVIPHQGWHTWPIMFAVCIGLYGCIFHLIFTEMKPPYATPHPQNGILDISSTQKQHWKKYCNSERNTHQ